MGRGGAPGVDMVMTGGLGACVAENGSAASWRVKEGAGEGDKTRRGDEARQE